MNLTLSKTLFMCAVLCMYFVSIQAPPNKDTNSLSPNRNNRAHREEYPMEETNLYGGMVVDRQSDAEFEEDLKHRLADEAKRDAAAKARSRGARAGGHTSGK